MQSSNPALLSADSRLLLNAYKNMMNTSDGIISSSILNDSFLATLSSKITAPKTTEDKQLCLLSLNILSWILSCVSCSDDVVEAVSQKNFIINNVHIQSSLSKVVALMDEEKQHVDVMNLCLFVVMEQCTPDLLHGSLSTVVQAIAKCISNKGIPSQNNEEIDEQSWKQPIIACSALCALFEQIPEEILSRHSMWTFNVFLRLVDSFSEDASHTKLSSKSVMSITETVKIAPSNSKTGDFSPSSYCADVDSRLLPLAVSAPRLLHFLTAEMIIPLLPTALSSYEVAMKHIWYVCYEFTQLCLPRPQYLLSSLLCGCV